MESCSEADHRAPFPRFCQFPRVPRLRTRRARTLALGKAASTLDRMTLRDDWLSSLIENPPPGCFVVGCITCGSGGRFRSAVAQKCMEIAGVRFPLAPFYAGSP